MTSYRETRKQKVEHMRGRPHRNMVLRLYKGENITSNALKLINEFSRSLERGSERPSFTSIMSTSFIAYEVHLAYPMVVEPRCSSTRVFVIFLLIYTLILTTAYKSNLTAFLTVTRDPQSIETFKELYESGLQVLGIPFFETSLRASGNQYLRALADKFVVRYHFQETTKDVLAGRAVTINSKIYLDAVAAQMTTPSGKPLVRTMKECFSTYSVGIAYPRNSPLKLKFDQVIARMFESGLVGRWLQDTNKLYKKLEKEKVQETQFDNDLGDTAADGFVPISMDHIQGIFILLAFGYLAAALIFVAERKFS
ncbi:ionotropic receptor 21a-like [Macrobrachium rosenbergii]|uniref:ionotropic receptor 21a-like n=1 Tax=Macrobrachium rosenbergii TaxID=79674 RepID=UPI0034D645A6